MDTGAVKEIYGKRSERVFSLVLDDYVFTQLKIHDFKRDCSMKYSGTINVHNSMVVFHMDQVHFSTVSTVDRILS